MKSYKKIFFTSILCFSFTVDLSAMSKIRRIFSCCFGRTQVDEIDQERLNSGNFACLPNEMIAEILKKLSDEELIKESVAPICKRFHWFVEYELTKRAKVIAQRFIDQLLAPNLSESDLEKLPAKFRTEIMTMPKKMEILVQQNFERLMRGLLEKEFKKQDCLKGDLFNRILPDIGGKEFYLLEGVVNKKIEAGDLRAKQIDNFIFQKIVNLQGIDLSDEIFKNLPEEQSAKIGDHILKIFEIFITGCFSKLVLLLLDLEVEGKVNILFGFLKDLVRNVFEPIYVARSKDIFLDKLSLLHKKFSDFLEFDVVPLKLELEELRQLIKP